VAFDLNGAPAPSSADFSSAPEQAQGQWRQTSRSTRAFISEAGRAPHRAQDVPSAFRAGFATLHDTTVDACTDVVTVDETQYVPDELLTVAEVAQTLKLNPQTVRNMIDRGELPAIRVGSRRVRILRSDLEAFLAQGRRLTHRSPTRVDFDDAMGAASKAIRSRDRASAADALRLLSEAALALAPEIKCNS
jgi:excisionase family DNA binding protein